MAKRVKRFQPPSKLAELVKGVIGQDDAKRKLVSAFSQYTLSLDDPDVQRPVVLLIGPSGSGKTYMVEKLARGVGIPFELIGAGSMSPPGYRGTTMKDLLQAHFLRRIEAKTTDEAGVIVVDEMDKWTRAALGAGVNTEAAAAGNHSQAECLRYVEHETITFTDEAKDDERLVDKELDTGKLFWVFMGAFTNIDSYVRHRLHNDNLEEEETLDHVVVEDLVAYGVINELANRFNTVAHTRPLKQAELRDILRQQDAPDWERRFRAIGCELLLEDGALGRCASHAHEMKTGARGAKAMLRRSMDDLFYEASIHNARRVRVDVGTVVTGRMPDELAVV